MLNIYGIYLRAIIRWRRLDVSNELSDIKSWEAHCIVKEGCIHKHRRSYCV